MKEKHFFIGIFFYFFAVLYLSITTPITPHEAIIFYTEDDLLSTLMHYGKNIFSGFLGIRLFFIFFGILSVSLFYLLSLHYFEKKEDAYLSTALFMFLPGILTASTLVNISIVVLPLVILFVLCYEKKLFWILPFIMLLLFLIHQTSMIFFIAVLLFSFSIKDIKLGLLSSLFLVAFFILEKGIEIGGRPSGHFIEIFGLYASVFSPLLFFYFFYALYHILTRGKKTLLWYISFSALIFSLVLSIRQRVYIADFAPYVLISIVLMLDVFNHTLLIRLNQFRRPYKIGFYVVMSSVALSAMIIIFHQFSFYMMPKNSKHFAKRIYRPYILANKLKLKGVHCYDLETNVKGREVYQLRYYGIVSCDK